MNHHSNSSMNLKPFHAYTYQNIQNELYESIPIETYKTCKDDDDDDKSTHFQFTSTHH